MFTDFSYFVYIPRLCGVLYNASLLSCKPVWLYILYLINVLFDCNLAVKCEVCTMMH